MFDWVWSKLRQFTVIIGSLNTQDMISQINIYVVDTVLRYYVLFMYEGQYLTQDLMVLLKNFFKNLLHVFV